MSIVLYRIDDRLIHGQVVVGWGQPLRVGFIVLVDDAVRASEWEQDLHRMGVPPQIEVVFASAAEAAERLPEWEANTDRKSTRLNSSHSQISYAVFCLKKKISA